jgi:hypothetical protein
MTSGGHDDGEVMEEKGFHCRLTVVGKSKMPFNGYTSTIPINGYASTI